MAFKMKGFNPGDGTGLNSVFKAKSDRKTRKAEKLRLRAEELKEKGKDKRAESKERRAGVKEQMAENLKAGKDKKANLIDDRGGQTPGMKHRTDRPKEHDTSGKKIKGTGKKSSESKASDAGTANMSFREAFRHARDDGKKTFTWRGKNYHTRTRSEEKKGKLFGSGKTKAEIEAQKANTKKPDPDSAKGRTSKGKMTGPPARKNK